MRVPGAPWIWAIVVCAGCGSDPAAGDGGLDDAPPEALGPCTLPRIDQAIATLAGCAERGTTDGPRGTARFDNPTNVAVAPDGTTYVTDFDSDRLRAVAADGSTTTIFLQENFARPFGIALAPDGALYVETDDNDLGEHSPETGTVWRVDPTTQTAEVVARNLGRPRGLAVLPDGRIAMADHVHHVVSILDPATSTETPLAGMLDAPGHANGAGTDARFAQPYDLVLLPGGDLAVTDLDNHRIRRVTLAGVVTDLAGSGGIGTINGPVAVATFDGPQAIALAPNGALFVTDIHRYLIRRIHDGQVATIAGDGTPGWLDSALPRNGRFYGLEGLDANATRVVIADGNRGNGMPFHHVRVVQMSALPP